MLITVLPPTHLPCSTWKRASVDICIAPSAYRFENWTRSSSVKSRGSTCLPPSSTTTSRSPSARRWASTAPAAPLPIDDHVGGDALGVDLARLAHDQAGATAADSFFIAFA